MYGHFEQILHKIESQPNVTLSLCTNNVYSLNARILPPMGAVILKTFIRM